MVDGTTIILDATTNTIELKDTIASGSASDQYYVALDALRLENVSSVNPLYGLTGYSVVQNTNAETVTKLPNTSNYVEFRFSIGVT
jgi:hypothetical protein